MVEGVDGKEVIAEAHYRGTDWRGCWCRGGGVLIGGVWVVCVLGDGDQAEARVVL